MNKDFYIAKRDEFFSKFPNKSIAIINSGIKCASSLDGEYPFEVDRNFYYFTGIDYPDMKLMLSKTGNQASAVLFIPRLDINKEKWTGRLLTVEQCRMISGIQNIKFIDEMDDEVYSAVSLNKADKCFLYFDAVKSGRPQTVNNITYFDFKRRYPRIDIKDLSTLTMPMRAVKSEEEIEAIKKSCEITNAGIEEAVKHIKSGIKEYEIQACFEYVVKRRGGKPAFNTIAASGENAIALHYNTNKSMLKDGDMLLLDCGASIDWYNSDVTRTFPVSGKFTERQLEIYTIVLKGNKEIIDAVKPGVTLKQLNDKLIDLYARELKAIGLISDDNEVAEYYYHGVSHSLGLDTHDVFDKNIPLEPGMIITVEPGLYIAKYDLGIRIEDDVLVTEKGHELLTHIIKEPSEIEECMNVWEVK